MNFIGAFSQPLPDPVCSPYYTHGPSGETYYVWPAYSQSPDVSPGSSEYSPTANFSHGPRRPTGEPIPPQRTIKRRVTANKKERRRTMSINNAFAELRECIPFVPQDTKLSKIKTLRLATSYIAHLMDILAQDDHSRSPEQTPFKLEVTEDRKKPEISTLLVNSTCAADRKRGRTGWPQHVWALELKHENST